MASETREAEDPFEEAERLVGLRELMEEGIRRSSDQSAIGRRVAIVVLDGAVEAAIGVCLDKFGDEWADRLDDGYSKLVAHLRDTGWNQQQNTAWPEVRRLRRARNNAQHHGITPDHEDLASWSGAVLTFVESVVSASFNRELSMVCLADALATEALREQFKVAEQHLAGGDTVGTIIHLATAFADARRRWDAEHQSAHLVSFYVPTFRQQSDPETAYVQDLLSVAVFASDLGEYVWWQSVWNAVQMRPDSAIVTTEEARRAMSFVFGWIMRWEAFSSTYSADRLGRLPTEAPPSSPYVDGRPTVLPGPITIQSSYTQLPPPGTAPDRYVATVPFAAGSDEVPWSQWRNYLQAAFSSQHPSLVSFTIVRDNGTLETPVTPDIDRMEFLGAVEAAFAQAVEARNTGLREEATINDQIAESEPLRNALLACSSDAEPVFDQVVARRVLSQVPERNVSVLVDGSFTPRWHMTAVARLTDRFMPAVNINGPGQLNGVGIEMPASTNVDEALRFVEDCLTVLRSYEEGRWPTESQVEQTRATIESRLNP